MKLHPSRFLLCSLLSCALATVGVAQGRRGRPGNPAPPTPPQAAGAYTTVSGTISQFNYDRDAEVDSFLMSNKTLVHLPPRAVARLGSAMHVGDNIQVAGLGQTSPAGIQTLEAQSIQDRTSGANFSLPQPGAAAPFSGSGRIQQLNYGRDGSVNGFVFADGNLATMPAFSASNPSSIKVGATVAYSGYARKTISGRTVIDLQTLTVNGQSMTLAMAAPGRRPDAPLAPPAPASVNGAPVPPPAPGSPAPATPAPAPATPAHASPLPAGRTSEPTVPPPPPQTPQR